MSVSFGFYNSFEGDRTYDAVQMSSIFDGVISDGVFATVADAFEVVAVQGNRIGVKSGRAWFNHTWTYNDSLYPIDLGPSEILQDRIDAVVLEVNELIRTNRLLVLEGEPALENPSNPTLTNTADVHQYVFAYIYRTGGSESVTQADITNMIGTSGTPFVTGVIDTINIDILVAQWQAEYTEWFGDSQNAFDEWFDEMKDQLSEDAAGHLQNQIGNLANLTTTAKNNLVEAINEAASTGGGVFAEDVTSITAPSTVVPIEYGGTGAGTVADALSNLGFGWHYTTTDDDTGNMELRTTNCSEGSVRCWYNDVFAIFSINVKSANSWTNGTNYTVAILAQRFIDLIGHTFMDAFTGIISNGYPCQVLLNTWETGDRLQVKPINTSPASGTWYVATFVVPITH